MWQADRPSPHGSPSRVDLRRRLQGQALLNQRQVSSLGTWRHLATRFFSVLRSRPLTPGEIDQVNVWAASLVEKALFFAQPVFDQRHAFRAARYVAGIRPDRPDLIRAALLHDVGKRHASLGPIGRALVSAHSKVGGTPKGKGHAYLAHGPGGAAELETAEADPVVIEFARHHHGQRPPSIPEDDWKLLLEADHA